MKAPGVVLITGASSGIGEATARLAAGSGPGPDHAGRSGSGQRADVEAAGQQPPRAPRNALPGAARNVATALRERRGPRR